MYQKLVAFHSLICGDRVGRQRAEVEKQEVLGGLFYDKGEKNMMFTITRPLIIYKHCHL